MERGDEKAKEHLELIRGKLCAQNVVQILIATIRSSNLRDGILVKKVKLQPQLESGQQVLNSFCGTSKAEV